MLNKADFLDINFFVYLYIKFYLYIIYIYLYIFKSAFHKLKIFLCKKWHFNVQ